MSNESLQALIKSLMGISPDSVGIETIRRIVERRMEIAALTRLGDYLALVERSQEERQSLINDISVPETWFFRDHEPFKVLADHVKSLRLKKAAQPLSILSVPCSSGEEPYSIAMVMFDAGLSDKDFRIDAVDISTSVLDKARCGVYGSNSFRGKDNAFREKYFVPLDGRYQIASKIKKTVSFHNANVLSDGFMEARAPYDVIFCRNLLIYFDYETKCRVLTTLHRLMKDDALLILGHAETGRMVQGLFESIRLPGSFAYRKGNPLQARQAFTLPQSSSKAQQGVLERMHRFAEKFSDENGEQEPVAVKKRHFQTRRPLEPAKTLHHASDDVEAMIARIQTLADQGDLKEALTVCDALIASTPDSVQAYYLKGVILLAVDLDEEATIAFKRALYLDSQHYESMIQLSILAEEQGDQRAAENYRQRAERVRTNKQVTSE